MATLPGPKDRDRGHPIRREARMEQTGQASAERQGPMDIDRRWNTEDGEDRADQVVRIGGDPTVRGMGDALDAFGFHDPQIGRNSGPPDPQSGNNQRPRQEGEVTNRRIGQVDPNSSTRGRDTLGGHTGRVLRTSSGRAQTVAVSGQDRTAIVLYGPSDGGNVQSTLVQPPHGRVRRVVRSQGIRIILYVDDLLLLGRPHVIRRHKTFIDALINKLGLVFAPGKGNWDDDPTSRLDYLGVIIDLEANQLLVTRKFQAKLLDLSRKITATCRRNVRRVPIRQ
ncbi:hypothetical protein SARC_15542 [Sphaeroforma arctica JP610]|uniref:Reverse transcriptase domain-containing protein n=1 Tax=Sphaeroforma arctica JP610 TaxID=667725 RepID=A0A0L0F5B8_9EUKA|nr:hypothetical protein SARC_15542 [Sphaeroforma arctica JP610]KNC71912.1 hypothetical protein SARC_15542 [Sphaeroforma arctica JP610]|eukprot:XP_014145814.1 hypothetical protein SARC_15542 [Sphaeroforma arctica JP610]